MQIETAENYGDNYVLMLLEVLAKAIDLQHS
jgi:hypothetical protein